LRAGTPSIEISGATAPSTCYLNPMTLNDAEAQIVTARLVELLG
jgi:hypothetical protein